MEYMLIGEEHRPMGEEYRSMGEEYRSMGEECLFGIIAGSGFSENVSLFYTKFFAVTKNRQGLRSVRLGGIITL
jgi:hypothetical protein